jgi:transcriptional regulator GlxA family with amidase domain
MSDFNVGFVIFPKLTQLDFTGPYEVLSRLSTPPSTSAPSRFPDARTHVIAKTMLPVSSDRGLGILPTCTFESCPPLDLICVPGGPGWSKPSPMSRPLISFATKAGARSTSPRYAWEPFFLAQPGC